MKELWNPYILLPLAAILLLAGALALLAARRRGKRYAGRAQASVLRVEKRRQHTRGVTAILFIPTLEYTVDGVRYEQKGPAAGKHGHYAAGQTLQIAYNPAKPEDCALPPGKAPVYAACALLPPGAALLILGVLSAFMR